MVAQDYAHVLLKVCQDFRTALRRADVELSHGNVENAKEIIRIALEKPIMSSTETI